MFKLICRFPL